MKICTKTLDAKYEEEDDAGADYEQDEDDVGLQLPGHSDDYGNEHEAYSQGEKVRCKLEQLSLRFTS